MAIKTPFLINFTLDTWIANMEIALDPNSSVIKRLWCIVCANSKGSGKTVRMLFCRLCDKYPFHMGWLIDCLSMPVCQDYYNHLVEQIRGYLMIIKW